MAGKMLKIIAVITALFIASTTSAAINLNWNNNTRGLRPYYTNATNTGNISTFNAKAYGLKAPKKPWLSTRPLYWNPSDITLPLTTNWKSEGYEECEIWQAPRNVWGCHHKHGFNDWASNTVKAGFDPRTELRKIMVEAFQSKDGRRPMGYRTICLPSPGRIDESAMICVSWAEVFRGIMTDEVIERVIDKAFSCSAAGGWSAQIMARFADLQNRVICISNRAGGCKNHVCEDAPYMTKFENIFRGASINCIKNEFNYVTEIDTKVYPPRCVRRSPAEQLDQYTTSLGLDQGDVRSGVSKPAITDPGKNAWDLQSSTGERAGASIGMTGKSEASGFGAGVVKGTRRTGSTGRTG